MSRLAQLWHCLTTTRYTRILEAEVERLRADNRALVNSLLGTAGVPPVDLPSAANAKVAIPLRPWGPAWVRRKEAESRRQPTAPPPQPDRANN